jgi:hypothetical protein
LDVDQQKEHDAGSSAKLASRGRVREVATGPLPTLNNIMSFATALLIGLRFLSYALTAANVRTSTSLVQPHSSLTFTTETLTYIWYAKHWAYFTSHVKRCKEEEKYGKKQELQQRVKRTGRCDSQ